MYAHYDLASQEIATTTDFESLLAQLLIIDSRDEDKFSRLIERTYIRFADLPQPIQDNWKPVLHTIFCLPQVFYCSDPDTTALGICSFAIHADGWCNFDGADDVVYNRFYNRFVYGYQNNNWEAVLIVHGLTMRNSESGLIAKRERAQIIDAILLDL